MNEITGRKQSKKGILEGRNKEERTRNWYNHFKQLLGEEPNIDEEDEEINTVIDDNVFRTGQFEMDDSKRQNLK